MCHTTGLLQNFSRSFLQSHTKRVCSKTLGFEFVFVRGNTSYLASPADLSCYKYCHYRFNPLLSLWREKHFQAKCTLLLRWLAELCQLNCTLKVPISLHWLHTTLDDSSHLNECIVDVCGQVKWILWPFSFLQQQLFFLVCLVNISLMSRLGLFPFLSMWSFLLWACVLYHPSTHLQSFLSSTFSCSELHSSLLPWLHL